MRMADRNPEIPDYQPDPWRGEIEPEQVNPQTTTLQVARGEQAERETFSFWDVLLMIRGAK